MLNREIAVFKEKCLKLAHLNMAVAVLDWDQSVYMPVRSSAARGAALAHLTTLGHQQLLSLNENGLLEKLVLQMNAGGLSDDEAVMVRETWREFERESKLPEKFVAEFAEISSLAYNAWAEARAKKSFKLFRPHLEKIVDLSRRQAKYLGYVASPYDALLDIYEPGLTSLQLAKTFAELRGALVPLLNRIKKSNRKVSPEIIKGNFPIAKQVDFNNMVAARLGFDFEAGRMDVSPHPFTSGFHPHDVRITTRYDRHNVIYALGSTIHEVGHGLYEQGLSAELFGTSLGEAVSLGIHESQSRLWENFVGKSRSFWDYFYPELRKKFPKPFAEVRLDQFYQILNKVEPSFIRTEADEVTYNLHIILRFEIEKMLLEGELEVGEVPELWNKKMEQYFGLKVPDDASGVLQDVHWSSGFGYFPSYTLGTLYAAQIFASAKKAIPGLSDRFAVGDFEPLRNWLRENIHFHGKRYPADELIRRLSGSGLEAKFFTDYIEDKYCALYGI